MIEKIIHQSWETADVSTYADGKIGVLSQKKWRELYPDFKYMFWTDDDRTKCMNKLGYGEVYKALNAKIKKVDFFRYAILYEYGGFWSDIDFISNERIPDKYLEYDFIGYRVPSGHVPLEQQIQETVNRGKDNAWFLGQAFFGCVSKYPGLSKIIDYIEKTKKRRGDVLWHTGPYRIHKIFLENNLLYSNKAHIFTFEEISDSPSNKKEVLDDKGKYGHHLAKYQWWCNDKKSEHSYNWWRRFYELFYNFHDFGFRGAIRFLVKGILKKLKKLYSKRNV